MAKITAWGMYRGLSVSVTVTETEDGLQIDFDEKEYPPFEEAFREKLKKRYPVAGTYFPPEESMLNAAEVLQFHFFDDGAKEAGKDFFIEGDIGEIPFEPDSDIVY